MNKNNPIDLRRKKRYSHIYITLYVKIGFQWKQIKALDWDESGFNFFLEDEIPYENVLFKKGQTKFAGKIQWRRRSDDSQFNLEMMLNTFLYEKINRLDTDSDTVNRIVKLIRAEGMIDEKRKILAALNPRIGNREINERIGEQAEELQVYRYGVNVSSKEWADITNYALEASSVVDAMDRVGKGLSELVDTVEKENPGA